MSPFDVPESDKITLVTADDPPQRYVVSRSRLSVLSGVFRDLLLTPTTEEDKQKQEIPLTDKNYTLCGLMLVLEGEEEKLSLLNDSAWSDMARMADKYDCTTATREVVSYTWQLIAQGKAQEAFYLALVLNNEALLQQLCPEAVDKGWHLGSRCDPTWKDRLTAYHLRRRNVVRDCLLAHEGSGSPNCVAGCSREDVYAAGAAAILQVIRSYKAALSVEAQLRSWLERPGNPNRLCTRHVAAFCNVYSSLDRMIDSQLDIAELAKT